MLGNDASSYLPKQNSEYVQQEYWERRFEKEVEYEWLSGYSTLRAPLLAVLTPLDASCPVASSSSPSSLRILHVGCGSSNLSACLYNDGFVHIHNLDFSNNVIAQQRARHEISRPFMSWSVGDFLQLPAAFEAASFDVVIEKCSMDALVVDSRSVWSPSTQARLRCRQLLRGISHVLKPQGKFISVSFTQPHFRRRFLQRSEFGWSVSVNTIGEGILASFIYVCTKGETCTHWPHSDSDNDDEAVNTIDTGAQSTTFIRAAADSTTESEDDALFALSTIDTEAEAQTVCSVNQIVTL